jgi:hypothetical protein
MTAKLCSTCHWSTLDTDGLWYCRLARQQITRDEDAAECEDWLDLRTELAR